MLINWTPKNTKFKKLHKNVITKIKFKKTTTNLYYGVFGLKILSNGLLNIKHMETLRIHFSRFIKKKEKLWIRGICDIPVTKKPKEMRMGKGKGSVDNKKWSLKVAAGMILCEIGVVRKRRALWLFNSISKKLPFRSFMILNKKKIF